MIVSDLLSVDSGVTMFFNEDLSWQKLTEMAMVLIGIVVVTQV